VTEHERTIGGALLAYRATAGRMPLLDDAGKPRAHVFFVAYEMKGADAAKRPVTFVFNGGPGSPSLWLHLGTVGPKRVTMSDEGMAPVPPGRFVVNDETWLDLTDLVFIDPVGTGYSRPAKGHKQSEFSGLSEDTESVGEFIRIWTTRHGRWGSPKYLAGESYGTTRAASLASHLQERHGMYLNGLVLVSTVLDFQTIRFGAGNDLPYALYLPAYTATAWYHGALGDELQEDLQATLRRAEAFAMNRYWLALAKGDALPDDERKAVAQEVALLTGLDAAFVLRSDLRISQGRFCKELLRAKGRTVGRLDSRYKGIDRDESGAHTEHDPSMSEIVGPFTAAVLDYLRAELRYESDLKYESLSGSVGHWRMPEGRYATVADSLREAMTKNPHLRVFVASGYYDLATPYSAADYTIRHLGLDATLRDHVAVRYYEAGHMMYVHTESRRKLKSDLTPFFR
jgi:carboxypeptidase C (cathepsin A)